jgi:biotin carboxyl carrier protein
VKYEVTVGESTYTVEINDQGQVLLDDEPVEVDFNAVGESGLYSLLVDNESFEALLERGEEDWHVLLAGNLYDVSVVDERSKLLRSRATSMVPDSGEVAIRAPMPGLVVALRVELGQAVESGDNLAILESMKMENEIKAPRAGAVERIDVAAGDSVEQGQILVVIV